MWFPYNREILRVKEGPKYDPPRGSNLNYVYLHSFLKGLCPYTAISETVICKKVKPTK
jgi:hypothetical protein